MQATRTRYVISNKIYLAKDFAVLEVVGLGDDDAFDRIDMVHMVDKVSLAQVDGQLTVGRCFLKDFDRRDHVE